MYNAAKGATFSGGSKRRSLSIEEMQLQQVPVPAGMLEWRLKLASLLHARGPLFIRLGLNLDLLPSKGPQSRVFITDRC